MDVVDLDDLPADGLAVGHLRLADVGLDLELAAHPVDQDVEVELAHAADDGLAGLRVEPDPEGRVLLGELPDSDGQLPWSPLVFGSMANVDDRLREGHRLEDHRCAMSHSVSPVVVSFRPIIA